MSCNSSRQTEILKILTSRVDMTLNEIAEQLKDAPAPRTIRDDLTYLKKLKLIILNGFGRGAKWTTAKRGDNKAVIRRNLYKRRVDYITC